MAAYAALVSLLQLIHDLERHPSPPISLDKHLVESITQHVTYFQEFLHDYNNPLDNGDEEEAGDPLEMRIANTAYAAEDAIESHIVDRFRQLRSNKITRFLNCFRSSNKLKYINLCRDSLQRVIEEMDSVKKVVVDPEKQKKKKEVVVFDQVDMTCVLSSVALNKTILGSDDVLASIASNETRVGIDDVLLEIMEKLVGGQLDFQVMPIGGMGGIGKTFLAKTIYGQRRIKDRFDKCAWATISQQYNTREILCELLSQATNRNKEQLSGKSEDVLGMELYKYLFNRRFLIVMDDIWSIDAWDKIQCFFPNNENGSRVLVTTRLFQLCSQLNSNYSLPMSFLNESSSWNLFSKTVFGDKSCPPVLKKIAEKIVANCRGLPLSIVVVGGLLKNMDNTLGSWESIRDNLSSVVNMENDKNCLRLLKLSYNHLPVYLKPCFLYMGVFEEDDEIRVSRLVKLWVSEGFVQPTNEESLETIARGFLQDLVDRNLILIGELGSTGSIKSCKIHDLLRDMCFKESHKERFYHVIGQCNPPPSQRRVVIPPNTSVEKVSDELRSMPYARSVICEYGQFPLLQNLKLLRTLHAYNFRYFSYNTSVDSFVFRYANLRHLAIYASRLSSFLPCVRILWNLQTLIVNSWNNRNYFIADIWKMPQFRHIEFVGKGLCLRDPPGVVRDENVVIMENLHTLKGVINFKCSKGVVKRIPNIKKLKLRYDKTLGTDNKDRYCVGNIKSLCGLESLSVSVFRTFESHTYMQKMTFPHSLKKLSLSLECEFEWEDILEKIGSLPLLKKLELTGGHFGKGKWETEEGQFPSLKYLEMCFCRGLVNWTAAEEGSNILPRLEHLSLRRLVDLKEIPYELGNIDMLKSIKLTDFGEGLVKSVKEMFDEQVELQGGEDQLSFHVQVNLLGMNQHLLSLAGPNFYVDSSYTDLWVPEGQFPSLKY